MLREEGRVVLIRWRFCLILCTLILGCLLADQASGATGKLSPAENYVRQQAAKGEWADLQERFGDQEKDRTLSARFLEDLLTGAYKVHRKGVRIKNAVIDEPVDLMRARIPHAVDLADCRFRDRFDCHDAVFEKLLIMTGSHFDQKVDFNTLKVGTARFDNATFKGSVDFIAADIRGQFNAQGARFEGEGEANLANFYNLKVSLDAFFDNAVFKGPVNFVTADIGGQLIAQGARFESPKHPVIFEFMRVGQSAIFQDVTCRSRVSLTYGSFLDLYFQGAGEDQQAEAASPGTLQLTGTQVQRKLSVTDLKLNSLEAGHLRVKGPATFARLNIKERADFQNAALETLEFDKITWPEQGENLKLDGLTYNSLCVDGPDNFAGALGLVKRATFNPQNYVQLEDCCKRRGHQDWADTVLIAMKDRELDPPTAWYIRGLKKIFWGWPAGYGRKPLRLLVASLFIILVGAALFNPKYLDGDKNPLKSSLPWDPEYTLEDEKPNRSGRLREVLLRFLISLDQFLPAVNLGLANHWKARDSHFLVWLYFTVEQGFGWIFVSIGLAALYTQIK